MTDQPQADQTPARRTPVRKPPASTPDATASKPAATRTPAAKTPVAKTPAVKTPVAKTPAAKAPAAKTTTTKAPAAKTTVAVPTSSVDAADATATTTPVVAAPVVTPAGTTPAATTPAAAAPAGWYPVAPGSAQQRYWDGSAWTQHFHDPATAAAAAGATTASTLATPAPVVLKAPEGTSPSTVWFWLTALTPILAIGEGVASVFYFGALTQIITNYSANLAGADSGLAFILSLLLGLLVTIASILFPILDWWTLGKRGVPRPFHWAWSLFALLIGSPLVYAIGRTVVVKRRTGRGLAPLWVFIGLQIVSIVVWIFVTAVFVVDLVNQFDAVLGSSNFG